MKKLQLVENQDPGLVQKEDGLQVNKNISQRAKLQRSRKQKTLIISLSQKEVSTWYWW